MKAFQLKELSKNLANKYFVRYWLHWNYPQKEPWIMAIEIRDHDLNQVTDIQEMERFGFEKDDHRYYITRTDAWIIG